MLPVKHVLPGATKEAFDRVDCLFLGHSSSHQLCLTSNLPFVCCQLNLKPEPIVPVLKLLKTKHNVAGWWVLSHTFADAMVCYADGCSDAVDQCICSGSACVQTCLLKDNCLVIVRT